jgi:hypothetical protein
MPGLFETGLCPDALFNLSDALQEAGLAADAASLSNRFRWRLTKYLLMRLVSASTPCTLSRGLIRAAIFGDGLRRVSAP